MSDRRLDLSAKFGPPRSGGLVRTRLFDLCDHRVGLILAPAGHGKTTLLGQLAADFDGAVVWYRVDADDRNPAELAERMGSSLFRFVAPGTGMPGEPVDAHSLERLALMLNAVPDPGPVLLILDDFHVIAGTDSERALVQFISMAPPRLQVMIGARWAGGLDVEVLRLYGGAHVVGPEDLRFRSWEVETLFREVYRQPLRPEDAAILSRRTEGWAAGLAMFHLLIDGRSPAQRRRALVDLSAGSRLVRSYLVREVLEELPAQLRDFLRRTSVLGVLTGDLCDQLLETTDSQQVLEELERRRLFTTSPDGRTFGYHQVLRDHLELELAEQFGPARTREWYGRAGRLLMAGSQVPAAFRAYAQAGDWAAVGQLLSQRGEEVVAAPFGAMESLLPIDLYAQDPWLLLARARQLVGQGAFAEAVPIFRQAHTVAQDPALAARCLEECRAAALWLPEVGVPVPGWAGVIRTATQRNPGPSLAVALHLPGPQGRIAAALVSLLAGEVDAAANLAVAAAKHPDAEFDVVLMAGCVGRAVQLLTERPVGPTRAGLPALDALLDDEAEAGAPAWLIRIARELLPGPMAEKPSDPWGAAVAVLIRGVVHRERVALAEAETRFDELGAPIVALFAGCLGEALAGDRALDLTRSRWTPAVGRRVRSLGLHAALEVSEAWAGPVTRSPEPARAQVVDLTAAEAPVQIRLLGGLALSVEDRPVDLAEVRPRARSTLRLLALRMGGVVHRDDLAALLWPDLDSKAALRSVQVTVSSLRRLLETAFAGSAAAGFDLLVRRDQSYGLVLPPGCRSDLQELESHLLGVRSARLDGDRDGEHRHLESVLALYVGDLLPEEGPAEWVLAERERLRLATAGAAEALARSLTERGERLEAIEATRNCLRLDQYRDSAWQLLVELHTEVGNRAAAEAARLEHGEVLERLGL